jgi:hypothetical protein
MNRAINFISFMTPWNRPADDWARAKATEMHREGYAHGVIIAKLEAYGTGFYASSAIVRSLSEGGAHE